MSGNKYRGGNYNRGGNNIGIYDYTNKCPILQLTSKAQVEMSGNKYRGGNNNGGGNCTEVINACHLQLQQ